MAIYSTRRLEASEINTARQRFSDMKPMRYFLLTIIGALSLIMASCIEDGFTTSPTDVLTFSRDTVNFDTVFTAQGTPTARLIVRNKASKGINISSIRFQNPETAFSMNVDGMSGKDFNDVEIRAKDSIYIFIECYIPETQGSSPGLIEDNLEFVTNGVTQKVRLEAYGQNVTRLRNYRVTEDETFTADQPYVVFDSLTIDPGVVLTIEPGAKMLFHDGASMVVNGTLQAVGNAENKIDMRGDRLDDVLPDVGYDILAGQWKGIRIGKESFENRLEFVDMRSTVEGLMLDSCADLSKQKLTLVNSWLHNSQRTVLSSKYSKVDAYGCCFSEAAGAVVSLTGGEHNFVQCTISNNYLFSAITGPLLWIGHALPRHQEENDLPLMKANFENSILYGLPDDINIGDFTGADVFFRNVSFKLEVTPDDNFIDCIGDVDPMFYTDRAAYYFNYRLKPDSPLKSAGNPQFVTPIDEYDMDGVNRLQYGNPSLGAYQVKD